MNVLLTSAGRRTTLLKAFKDAVKERGGKVFAGDRDGLAPALYLADKAFRLPGVREPQYIEDLLGLVKSENIRLIVPTIDTELPVLAKEAYRFTALNCTVLISSEKLIYIAGDKWETVNIFRSLGFMVPESWLPHNLPAPEMLPERLVVKPRDGSASQNVMHVTRDKIHLALQHVPNPIIQEEVKAPEITIDALLDLSGRPVHYVPRIRLRALAGESIQGVTISDSGFRDWMLAVLEAVSSLGGRGPITLQAFLSERGPILSEINPRFGGGFPLTLAAGGHYPEWILQMVEGKEVGPCFGAYETGLYMTRFYSELFFKEPLWH